jgi:hypothetical protein
LVAPIASQSRQLTASDSSSSKIAALFAAIRDLDRI